MRSCTGIGNFINMMRNLRHMGSEVSRT